MLTLMPPTNNPPPANFKKMPFCPHQKIQLVFDDAPLHKKVPVIDLFYCHNCGDSINQNHHPKLFLKIMNQLRQQSLKKFSLSPDLINGWYLVLQKLKKSQTA